MNAAPFFDPDPRSTSRNQKIRAASSVRLLVCPSRQDFEILRRKRDERRTKFVCPVQSSNERPISRSADVAQVAKPAGRPSFGSPISKSAGRRNVGRVGLSDGTRVSKPAIRQTRRSALRLTAGLRFPPQYAACPHAAFFKRFIDTHTSVLGAFPVPVIFWSHPREWNAL